jgi:hypothetical protein
MAEIRDSLFYFMAKGPIKQKIKKLKGQPKLKGLSGIAVKPTEQDIKIAEGIALGKSKKAALMDAGVSEANARSNSAELTSAPGVQKALRDAFAKVNVGVDRIAVVIDEGLKATKVVDVTKDNDYPFLLFPDYSERRQMARLASELMDLFPEKELEFGGTGSLNVIIRRSGK